MNIYFEAIVTYARYKVVSAANTSHLVLVENLLEEPLGLDIPLHENDVGGVDEQLEEGLIPGDVLIQEEDDEGDEGNGVEGAVPEQRPPGEV